MDILDQISNIIFEGDNEKIVGLTRRAIEAGIPPQKILNEALIPGMGVVGDRFRRHEIFIPSVLLSARAMVASLDELKPLLAKEGIPSRGKVIIGSVQGDLHDIGKNLVGIMLKGAGFEVIDLGNDVPPERFVETARSEKAFCIGMSALLTTTMPVMKEVVSLLRQEGLADSIKTIIGGAPVSDQFAAEIGASAYGFDASRAVDLIEAMAG